MAKRYLCEDEIRQLLDELSFGDESIHSSDEEHLSDGSREADGELVDKNEESDIDMAFDDDSVRYILADGDAGTWKQRWDRVD